MGSTIAVDPKSAGVEGMEARRSRPRPNATRFNTTENRILDLRATPDWACIARNVLKYGSKETVFTQGDPAASVFYIQKGGVKLTVVNKSGKEAVVAILGPCDFFGEGCLAGQSICMATATTIAPSTVLAIEKDEMIRELHAKREFSDRFVTYMLARNIRVEADLVDQLFNSSEKRLARTLLLLARYAAHDRPQELFPEISQEMLAEMIGTTRPRVNFFMNKFRKLGFIEYGGRLRGLQVNKSRLSLVLQDC